jgi:kynurenine formamidase
MARRIVDLSVALEADIASDPPGNEPKITYIAHKDPAALSRMLPHFPGLTAEELPGGEAWAVEQLTVSTHNGTHLDAPYHFHSTMDGGKRAWTIDEVPLEWCMGRGVKLDFRHLPDGYVATPGDVEAELERTGVTLQPFDIVLVNTAAGARYGQPDYVSRGCGMGRAATLWLTERGVKITGTDAWSWDAPRKSMPRREMPRSSGKATAPVSSARTATSRSSRTSNSSRRRATRSAASPSRSSGPRLGSRASSRSSKREPHAHLWRSGIMLLETARQLLFGPLEFELKQTAAAISASELAILHADSGWALPASH